MHTVSRLTGCFAVPHMKKTKQTTSSDIKTRQIPQLSGGQESKVFELFCHRAVYVFQLTIWVNRTRMHLRDSAKEKGGSGRELVL